jgi:hypothetical protein
LQPQAPPQQPPPLELGPAEDLLPLLGAAKTDNCSVCLQLSHFGHETEVFPFITRRSYRSPQSSQTYS